MHSDESSYIWPVSISSKERTLASKKWLYFLQTTDLELLWVSVNNFSLESVKKRVRIKEERTHWQVDIPLLDWVEVILGDGCLPYGPGTEVHDVVAIIPNLAKQLGHPRLSPVMADSWQNMAQHIWLGDGAIYIWYHNLSKWGWGCWPDWYSCLPCQCGATGRCCRSTG